MDHVHKYTLFVFIFLLKTFVLVTDAIQMVPDNIVMASYHISSFTVLVHCTFLIRTAKHSKNRLNFEVSTGRLVTSLYHN